MKKLKIIAIACTLFTVLAAKAQKNEIKEIEKVITAFSKAGDENNSEKLASYLDDNYRVVMNRLFGSNELSVMPRSVYLEKIKSKEFGGDKRVVTIENVLLNGNTASAKVIFKGSKITFTSILVLIQDGNGNWKLISDTPVVS